MSENDINKKGEVFCIFNNKTEDIKIKIENSFIEYLKDTIKIQEKD